MHKQVNDRPRSATGEQRHRHMLMAMSMHVHMRMSMRMHMHTSRAQARSGRRALQSRPCRASAPTTEVVTSTGLPESWTDSDYS